MITLKEPSQISAGLLETWKSWSMGRGAAKQGIETLDINDISRFALDDTVSEMEELLQRRDEALFSALKESWIGKRIRWERSATSGSGIKRNSRGSVIALNGDGDHLEVIWDNFKSDYKVSLSKDKFEEITEEENRHRRQHITNSMNAYSTLGLRVMINSTPKSRALRIAGVKRGWRGEIVSSDPDTYMISVLFDKAPEAGPLPVDQLVESLSSVSNEETQSMRQKAFAKNPVNKGDRIEIISLGTEETRITPGLQGVVVEDVRINGDLKIEVDWDNGDNLPLMPGTDSYRVISL